MTSQEQPGGGVAFRVAAPAAYVTIGSSTAHDPSMARLIQAVGTSMPGDVRIVVLKGNWAFKDADVVLQVPGPRFSGPSFSAPDRSGAVPRATDDPRLGDAGPFDWLERPDIISIAAVQGPVTGLGLPLALACDVRVAAADATFTVPAITDGLLPSPGVVSHLVDAVGYARAFELCILGTPLIADRAQQWGLVTAIAPAPGLEAATDRLVTRLLALPRSATIETKALLREAARPNHRASSQASARRRLARERAGYADG